VKKHIYLGLLGIIIPSVVILSATLIYVLRDGVGSNELVDYLAAAVTVVVVVTLIILMVTNYLAGRLTRKITALLDDIDINVDRMTIYDELIPFAARIDRQEQTIRARVEEISSRTCTIETIMSNMQEGLILIDSDGTVLSANKSAHRVFGESVENKNVKHICRDDTFQEAVKQCKKGKNAETQMERDDRIYSVFFSPVISNGSGRGAVILLHDVTERQGAEKQRREFSANVSHELKTPLTTISALSEMIAQGMAKEDDIKNFAERINEQSGRLLILIDDIIRLSEFDEAKANREATNFNLWELSETVIKSIRDNAGSVEIELTGESFDISANNRMIDELLYNLIDNGVKYNKENGKVTVELKQPENYVCVITVSDTGIGISQEHHPHVFERFYRAEKSRSKKTGGTGLGLSIVKHITEYYNGTVELESSEGVGTTVICTLRYM